MPPFTRRSCRTTPLALWLWIAWKFTVQCQMMCLPKLKNRTTAEIRKFESGRRSMKDLIRVSMYSVSNSNDKHLVSDTSSG
ncbi:hypothetical protein BC832DRAFT_197490 [Gaertneriomyces semiglobifer]|nr:hypothetical protein BC832DRAFT_197490 [Gaertneriomyces semiglobifer]